MLANIAMWASPVITEAMHFVAADSRGPALLAEFMTASRTLVHDLSQPAELRAASKVSNEALATLSPQVKWQQSYVTDDKIFCVYIADDPEAIREHARLASLPVDAVHQIGSVIDPSTGDD
jgi:hypothetical protein